MHAAIRAIEYHLPEDTLTNADLASQCPDWPVDEIFAKTGIERRHIAGPEECASDLAVQAASKLFSRGDCPAGEVDFLLLCTQSPDYLLPTTACLIQDRLGLSTSVGALDINLGHSGFVYGLGMAKGLIETGQAQSVLLLTAETYSKYLHPRDRTTRTDLRRRSRRHARRGDRRAGRILGTVDRAVRLRYRRPGGAEPDRPGRRVCASRGRPRRRGPRATTGATLAVMISST